MAGLLGQSLTLLRISNALRRCASFSIATLPRWVWRPIKNYGSRCVDHERSADLRLPPTRSFLAHSESRVGELWRVEDHELLLRKLAEVDELCVAVWQRIASSRHHRTLDS